MEQLKLDGIVRKKGSIVWNLFEEAEDNMVVCRKCDTKLTANRTSGTTHLRRHILESCEGITKEERERIIASLGTDLFEPSSFRFDPDLTRSLLTLLFIDAKKDKERNTIFIASSCEGSKATDSSEMVGGNDVW